MITATLAVVAVIVCIVAIADYLWFEKSCDGIVAISNELGGPAFSIGGWPIGREFQLRFDRPLSDEDVQRLAAADPESRRVHIILRFRCKVPEARLAAMREMVLPHHITIVADSAEKSEKR
jgi:hypothetical protein